MASFVLQYLPQVDELPTGASICLKVSERLGTGLLKGIFRTAQASHLPLPHTFPHPSLSNLSLLHHFPPPDLPSHLLLSVAKQCKCTTSLLPCAASCTACILTRKPCCRRGTATARCRNCCFWFKVSRQHSLQV